MNNHLDRFSEVADRYARYRPTYPPELYSSILEHIKFRDTAWDAGTGNGQVAVVLSKYFKQVIATDISASQLRHAPVEDNISYIVVPSEQSGIRDSSMHLITVAQAVHWFELEAFTEEVRRVSTTDGVLAVWGYDLLRARSDVDTLIDYLHSDVLNGYWDPHRFLIDNHYREIDFPFAELPKRAFEMQHMRNAEDLLGYLRSWSAVHVYKQRHGRDPVSLIEQPLVDALNGESILCTTPVFLRMWEVNKMHDFRKAM